MQAAMAQLEAEAAAPPDDEPIPPTSGGRPTRKKSSADAKPADKKQLNFTDPESKIMKASDGCVQGYNWQAAVDSTTQVIVAHDVGSQQNDNRELVGMLDRVRRNTGHNPRELSADNGYFSAENLRALRRRRIRGYVPVTKQRMKAKPSQQRSAPRSALAVEMRRRIDRGGYRSRYRLRKQIVEPVFGQIKSARRFDRFSMRGRDAARGEWAMACTAHNLLKLARW